LDRAGHVDDGFGGDRADGSFIDTVVFDHCRLWFCRWFLHAVATGHGGVAALFVASIALGTIEASRHFLSSHLAAAGMAERNEVVSLLLREFDEDEADWLWQTDAQRRVRAVSDRFAEAMGMARADIDGAGFSLLSGPGGEGRSAEGRGVDRAGAPGIKELEEKLKARESFSNLWSG
jgi:PAS domain-containing protein